ncbi:MAG TPA: hypothetical protein VFQ68_22370 [Streptosporangiaceae bacterium]|nr:hypothetical protein [Streptosporangiaceae bacterium]
MRGRRLGGPPEPGPLADARRSPAGRTGASLASLAAFPAAELAWMALSPLAVAAAVTGAAVVVRRAGLSPRALRFETWLGRAACAAMAVFLAGACAWVAAPLGAALHGAPRRSAPRRLRRGRGSRSPVPAGPGRW